MDKILLKRGQGEVTLSKVPDYFGLRLKQGRARDEKSLVSSCGKTNAKVEHIDVAESANMDIFSVSDCKTLEATMKQLRDADASDVVTHMYSLEDGSDGMVIPSSTITVQFNPDVEKEIRESIFAEYGLEVLEDIDFIADGYSVRLTSTSTMNPLKIAARLQSMDEILAAEPDLGFRVTLKHSPADDIYRNQWHLNNRGGLIGLKQGADVSAEKAWEISRGSRDITICVIDDGFDLSHPDLSGNNKIMSPRDFGQSDSIPNPVSYSDNHGTACAGVALAEENDAGVVGLAPKCSFMPIRMSTWLTDQAVVDMFQYVIDNHADVVSCSWSAGAWNFPLSLKMTGIIHKAATQGRSNGKGCVILFAAGNEDRPLKGEKDNKVSHQGFALHADVMAIAASNSLDRRSSYSNFGPQIAVCAPSSGSPGRGVVTTDRRGASGYSNTDYTHSFGGTSSATPLVAGLAGLILSLDNKLSSAQVREVIQQSADEIDPENGDYQDGNSQFYGAGRINAERALKLVEGSDEDERLPETLLLEHLVNKPIPDQGQVVDTITFAEDVGIRQLEVKVDIKHTWRNDLRVVLIPPGSDEITLFDKTGGSEDDIVATLRSSDEPELFAGLISQSAQGVWQLRIEDTARQDVGVLKSWGLGITY